VFVHHKDGDNWIKYYICARRYVLSNYYAYCFLPNRSELRICLTNDEAGCGSNKQQSITCDTSSYISVAASFSVMNPFYLLLSRYSVVGLVPRLRAAQPRNRDYILDRGKGLYVRSVHLGSETSTANSARCKAGPFFKRVVPSDISTPTSAGVENKWTHTSSLAEKHV